MESVLNQYQKLIQQNKQLEEAIHKEKKELEEMKQQRRRTYDNLLTPEE